MTNEKNKTPDYTLLGRIACAIKDCDARTLEQLLPEIQNIQNLIQAGRDESPERVWITWDDAYPWPTPETGGNEYVRANLVSSPALTGGFICSCCGRSMELRVDGKYCNECGAYLATVRTEERKQAFGDAQGMMEAPAPGTMASTDFHKGFEAMRRLAKQILERAVLQAAGTENRKGEG